jgi:predicted lipoprotein
VIRRTAILPALALLAASVARADSAAMLQAVHRDWMSPRAAELVSGSERLTHALQAYCSAPPQSADAALEQARQAWRAGVIAWERLSAVAIGPVLERRSQRQIDFMPTRPRMILKAIEAAPETAAGMELIGAPAKGFPALEWLLWTQPGQPGSPECRYAVQVAAEIGREAEALEAGYRQAPDRRWDAAATDAAMNELVNQWLAGLEHLRWANMEMPVRVAITSGGGQPPSYPRLSSGGVVTSWTAQWAALRTLAAGNSPMTLETLLRGRGHGSVADALAQAVQRVDARIERLRAEESEQVLAAAAELAALKRLVEGDVATALGVSIGFSDSDGD